jgi:hypothetical protein
MDSQKFREHAIFTDMIKKKRAAKARIYRKNVLQNKRAKRLTTTSTENPPTLNKNIGRDVQVERSPQISPNIVLQGNHSVQKNKSQVVPSSALHTQPNTGLNTQSDTSQKFISKKKNFNDIGNLGVNLVKRFESTSSIKTPSSSKRSNIHTSSMLQNQRYTSQNIRSNNRQFNHIDNLGVNLVSRFEGTSYNATPSSSNGIQQTSYHETSLFDDDSADEYLYDDSEGINMYIK